jgi:ATP-dependent DNA helicase RecQ
LLTVNLAQISGFKLTARSWPVLRGEQKVFFRKDPSPLPTVKRSARGRRPDVAISGPGESALWEKLRRVRSEIAELNGIPAFVVFHDRTLKEMVALRPKTREELLGVTGVGETKADRYGEAFLSAIRGKN